MKAPKIKVVLDLAKLVKILLSENMVYVSASSLSTLTGLTLRSSARVLRELEALGLASRWSKSTYKLDLAKALLLITHSKERCRV